MEKDIKKDSNRSVLNSFYINDNTLLEYEINGEEVLFNIRFVENRAIHEHILGKVNIVEFVEHIDDIIQLNEDHSAIAFYQKDGDEYRLFRLYDTKEHLFALDDFMEEEYQKYFEKKKRCIK